MSTATIYFSPTCLQHQNADQHPECPERLNTVQNFILNHEINTLIKWQSPSKALKEQLTLAHTLDYIDTIYALSPEQGYQRLDEDTTMNPHTLSASLIATGALLNACDAALTNGVQRQFCLTRPPGHHAESNTAMGFCIFNAIAVAALHLANQGLKVAIIDFDVHHGNGSEEIVADRNNIYFFSSFQHPLYPFSDLTPMGRNIFKYPMPPGSDGSYFYDLFTAKILPELDAIKPDIILVSAGFDAHRADPLAQINLVENDYYWIMAALAEIADKHCAGRIISVLEGGYNLDVLGPSVIAHLQGLLGQNFY